MTSKYMRAFFVVGFATLVALLMGSGIVSFNFDPKFEISNETADAAEVMSVGEFDKRVRD